MMKKPGWTVFNLSGKSYNYCNPLTFPGKTIFFTEAFEGGQDMERVLSMLAVLMVSLFIFSSVSSAQHSHGGMSTGTPMKMETKDVLVEGIKVSFQMMANQDHKKMLQDMKMKEDIAPGTTHNITVTLKDEKTQKEITNAQVSMKVVDPRGKDQIKPMKYEDLMKSYDAYFNLPEKGKYQVMILAKIGEKKIPAGIYYEIK